MLLRFTFFSSPLSILFFFVAATMISTAGCATDLSDDVGAVKASIIGGDPNPENDEVVLLAVGNAICTGTMISEQVVLTAKHCILGLQPEQIRVFTGPDIDNAALYASVNEIRTTPGDGIVEQNGDTITGLDIAVLLTDADGSVTPRMWVLDSPPEVSTSITAIGYGNQLSGPPDEPNILGTKMRGTTEILALTDSEFLVAGPTTCFGDSGGPAVLPDGRVFGVVSRGEQNCTGTSIYTRSDAYVDLIKQAVVDTNGTLPETKPPGDDPKKESKQEGTGSGSNASVAQEGVSESADAASLVPGSDGTVRGVSCAVGNSNHAESLLPWLIALAMIVLRRRPSNPEIRFSGNPKTKTRLGEKS